MTEEPEHTRVYRETLKECYEVIIGRPYDDDYPDSGPFEHHHRWKVEMGDTTITETCRCGEKRTRAKTVQEHVGSGDIFKGKRPSVPRTHDHHHYHGNDD